jgi:hypothetical protein
VFSNWTPVLEKNGSHHPKLNAFQWAAEKVKYGPDMCPVSADLLKRSVMVMINYGLSVDETRAAAKKLIRTPSAVMK